MRLILVLVLTLLFSLKAVAVENSSLRYKKKYKPRSKSYFTQDSFFVGHSLTQTSYTLPQGKSMVGTFAIAYGITDNITLGTSPWLAGIYNTPNIILRTKVDVDKDLALGFQAGYFRSSEYLLNLYEMEFHYYNLTASKIWNHRVTSHFTFNAMYFLNEEAPFSIRVANPAEPLQISLSTLHEVKLNKNYGLGLEIGILGVNHSLPYLHSGISLFHKTKKRLIQIGMSISSTTNVRLGEYRYLVDTRTIESDEFKEIVTHPEVQLQYYF